MKQAHALPVTVLVALLAGCNRSPPPAPPAPPAPPSATSSAAQTALGRTVEKAITEAREELRKENIRISDSDHVWSDDRGTRFSGNLPKAEITPQGDLLIEGQAVAIDAAQRKMLLDYRGHVVAIAEAGMAIGVKGADLAGKAITETLGGLLSGNSEQIEQRIEAEAEKMEAEARQLCGQLPPMLVLQQRLSATLPAFKPYATMDQNDVDDCYNETDAGSTPK